MSCVYNKGTPNIYST